MTLDQSTVSQDARPIVCAGRTALSVVIPCFNEEEGLGELLDRTRAAAAARFPERFEIILIDDGSTDNSWERMRAAARADARIRLIRLSRNHGHQLALTAGLSIASGDLVFVIDADLQDPPELLAAMVDRMQADQADVVFGVRRQREGETYFKKFSASLFYRLLSRHSEIDLPLDAGDFRLMTARVARALCAMPEQERFIRGMVSWLGLKQVPFEYDREPRFAGQTKYPLKKMLRLAGDAFMGFSMIPLRFAAQFAGLMFAILLGVTGYALFSWIAFDTVSGWTSLMVLVAFTSAVQFLLLAVIGEYIGRTYLGQKRRPLFVVDEVVGVDPVHVDRVRQARSGLSDGGLWL